jgi:hypothetical protein
MRAIDYLVAVLEEADPAMPSRARELAARATG